jgi:tetratricopeptide (TPR) repeat protein
MARNMSGGSLISKIGSYLQIVTSDPRSTAFVPLAEAYRQIGLLDDALEVVRIGTRALPHFSPGFATMGRILGQMGRIDESMQAFAHALSIDRQSQSALVGLARLHLIRSERDQARKILQQAAEFHPDDETVRNMLVALDLPRPWRKSAELRTLLEDSVEQKQPEATAAAQPEAIYTATLAEIYVKQGLAEKAVSVYEEILKQDPDNQAVRKRLTDLMAGEAAALSVVEEQRLAAPAVPDRPDEMPGPAFTEENSQAGSARKSPLAILERWLVAIQQRREHVH